MKFTELNLHEKLQKGIEGAGFTTLMPVQEEALSHTLSGKDVSVQSQTGTGKTATFLITIFQHFLDENTTRNKKALILAPTRELAIQIEKEAKLLGHYLNFTIGCFYGGVGYAQQEKLLQENVNIIVGTPGRLLDFNAKKKLDFREIGYLVIDEADRMFDMGFLPDIRRILRNCSEQEKRQTMLFSATLDEQTRYIGREFMNRPKKIEISPEQVTVEKISQTLYHVAHKEKLNLLLGILKKHIPKNVLIFTNMKHVAAQVAKHLEYNGYKCLHISGDLPQSKRSGVLERFKSGNLPILVATDVAARGLHIDDLEMIINYDVPGDCENYVHRIGRTARAGKSGKAITLACEDYIYNLEAIESYIGMKIPVEFAEDTLYASSKSEGLQFDYKRRGGERGGDAGGKRRKSPNHKKTGSKSHRESSEGAGKPKKKKEFVEKPKPERERDDRPKADVKDVKAGEYRKKKRPDSMVGDKAKPDGAQQFKKKGGFKNKGRGKEAAKDAPDAAGEKRSGGQAKPRGGRKESMEDRLEYYKKKYGDNFNVSGDSPTPEKKPQPHQSPPTVKHAPPKKSFFKRLASMFSKK